MSDFMGRVADRIVEMLFENIACKADDPEKQHMADLADRVVRHSLRIRIYEILVEEYDK